MLYLAEVQKPKSGFNISGKSKSELKLLACQRTEHSWSAIPGEELIPGPDEVSIYSAGVLVLVDMNANRQIQSQLREAGKHLVSILQNLSRQIDKYKKEADEIESWRQSLSLQSQQLQLRQEEIYGREEELEQTRSELDRLTQESQALESIRDAHEKSRQELANRWEELRAKEQQISEHPASMGAAVSDEQVAEIRSALHQLGGGNGVQPQQLEATVTEVEFQQELLDRHWDSLRDQQQLVITTQAQLNGQQQEIDRRKQQLTELQSSLEQTQTEWEVQQHTLSMQQEYVQRLTARIEVEQGNYQKIYLMSKGGSPDIGTVQKLDPEQLETMPIAELQAIVETLRKEVERAVSFVRLQEEELQEKQETIDEIKASILTANEFDKLKLEAEISDEQDSYNMLDSTLDGQRQTMRERQAFLQIHNQILRQRQGHPIDSENSSQVEWESILKILDLQAQQQQLELTELEAQIQNLRAGLEQAKAKVEQQVNAYLVESEEVQKLDRQYQSTKQMFTELGAKINLYQEMIEPLQTHINTFKEQLRGLADAGSQPEQQQAMQHIESLLHNLVHGEV